MYEEICQMYMSGKHSRPKIAAFRGSFMLQSVVLVPSKGFFEGKVFYLVKKTTVGFNKQ
jgi:hypothetical protein